MTRKVKSHFLEDDSQPAPDGAATGDLKKLKDMVSAIMGDKAEPADHDEAMKCAHEAYEGYKEMGMQEEEAMKAAENSLKLAKHHAEKKAKKEAEDAKKATPAADKDGDSDAKKEEGHKEEAKENENEAHKEATDEIPSVKDKSGQKAPVSEREVKLAAENAKLKESIRQREISDHLESVLRESKLPTHATKAFRDLVDGAKTKEEITKKFNTFKEAFKDTKADDKGDKGAAGSKGIVNHGFGIFLEKSEIVEGEGSKGGFGSLAD